MHQSDAMGLIIDFFLLPRKCARPDILFYSKQILFKRPYKHKYKKIHNKHYKPNTQHSTQPNTRTYTQHNSQHSAKNTNTLQTNAPIKIENKPPSDIDIMFKYTNEIMGTLYPNKNVRWNKTICGYWNLPNRTCNNIKCYRKHQCPICFSDTHKVANCPTKHNPPT